MNKLRYALIVLVSVSFFACETDVDLNAEYKDITVVYGVLNPSDTTHYLKINKAFLGDGNANQLAADQSNFNYADGELEVKVEAFDENGSLKKSYSTVAGTVIRTVNEIPKDPGIFDNSSNVLYKFEESAINRNYSYKTTITNSGLDKEITAETKIVGEAKVGEPVGSTKFKFYNGSVSNGTFSTVLIRISPGQYVGRVSPILVFNYIEHYDSISSGGKAPERKRILMPLGELNTSVSVGALDWGIEGGTFFDNIRAGIPSSVPHLSHRELQKINMEILVAGDELSTYMEVNSPSTTVNQDKPNYTNIVNGTGIFSSREKVFWSQSQSETLGNISPNTISYLASMGLEFCFGHNATATNPCPN